MVGRRGKLKRSQKSLGNHQKSWIWGRHAVLEALRAGRWCPQEINLCEEILPADILSEVRQHARIGQIPLQVIAPQELESTTRARDHQGIAARMPEFPLLSMSELLKSLPEHPFLLVIDRIQDPFNFGSILRSADLFGVDGVIIGEREQVSISSHVARSSVGAVNYLNIAKTSSLISAVEELKLLGIQLVAATEKGTLPPEDLDMTTSVAMVIGNEGLGIAEDLREHCTIECCIPQSGHVDSLNAAVAAGILCYEVQRQRRK